MAAAAPATPAAPGDGAPRHVPVLIGPLIEAVSPVRGRWIDGTFGAGGYARALLEAGAERVLGIDRDPDAVREAAPLLAAWPGRLEVVQGRFGALDRIARERGMAPADGVVLDLGVSSMQLDRPERGFSFRFEGPLDMRMGAEGPSAADLVNTLPEAALADILYHYGEERAARRIARAIVRARAEAPITTTRRLAEIVAAAVPRGRGARIHPATRSFQALRIAVNDELGELARGLEAAERVLAPGGWLAVVTFHSLEDRVVKRFMRLRAGRMPRPGRHEAPLPETEEPPRFELITRKPIEPDAAELAANPRARSARLRIARRTEAPAGPVPREALGLPPIVPRFPEAAGEGG